MKRKALTPHTLTDAQQAADLAAAVRIGNTAVGRTALYLPGRVLPRRQYLPLADIRRAYLRLMIGTRKHGNFRQPLLVLETAAGPMAYLYGREQQVRDILAALADRGVTVGKPRPPKPN